MNGNPFVGATILTLIIGIPLCIYGAIAGGGAGFMSAIIFTITFYQFAVAMAAGGPGVGMAALLVIAFEVFILFAICAIFFGQEIVFEAASYWREPIAWGVAPIDNLWDGIMDGDSDKKWLGVIQICFGAGILLGIWFLIHLLGRTCD